MPASKHQIPGRSQELVKQETVFNRKAILPTTRKRQLGRSK
jgi:hypothetical protein